MRDGNIRGMFGWSLDEGEYLHDALDLMPLISLHKAEDGGSHY